MNQSIIGAAICALIISVATPAAAADEWKGKVELGALRTSGNSESESLNAGFALNHKRGNWANKLTAAAFSASQEDDDTGEEQQTAERYTASFKSTYDFSEFNYVFGTVTWEKDLFGGVRERTTETVGYGRRLIATDAHKLDAEIGAGARQQQSQKPDLVRENDAIVRGALNYLWNISKTSQFSQTLLAESGDSNTYSESVTALKLSIVGPTFVNISYTIKNNSDVPAGREKTDTFLALNVSYEFGNQ
ncbi:DUF481 domain-containing protein [bacterium]|nr:DUF481 domain-containing protein [bacterium]